MCNLFSQSNGEYSIVSPAYSELFVRALKDPHSYNPLSNGFFWFGFLWGIPVPLVVFWLHSRVTQLQYPTSPLSDSAQIFFLLHPLLFGFLFALMGSMVQHYIDRLREESVRDGLTGLYNHRYLRSEIKRRLSEAERYDLPFCLVMFDIDHFKKVNDRYGHQVGDSVLEELATLLMDTTRDADVVSRYGGEEFAVILPETRKGEASELAERIRLSVERHDFGIETGITISGGIAAYPDDETTESGLIRVADERLYRAKQSGRNAVKYQSE